MSDYSIGRYCSHIASLAETQIGEMEPSPAEIAEYIPAPRNTPIFFNLSQQDNMDIYQNMQATLTDLCLILSILRIGGWSGMAVRRNYPFFAFIYL